MADPLQFALSILEMRERTAQRDREFAALKQQREFENSLAARQDQRQQAESDIRVKAQVDGQRISGENALRGARAGLDTFIPDTIEIDDATMDELVNGKVLDAEKGLRSEGGRLLKVNGGYRYFAKMADKKVFLQDQAQVNNWLETMEQDKLKTTHSVLRLQDLQARTQNARGSVYSKEQLNTAWRAFDELTNRANALYTALPETERAPDTDRAALLTHAEQVQLNSAIGVLGSLAERTQPGSFTPGTPAISTHDEAVDKIRSLFPNLQKPAARPTSGITPPTAEVPASDDRETKRRRMNELRGQLQAGALKAGSAEDTELRQLLAELKRTQ